MFLDTISMHTYHDMSKIYASDIKCLCSPLFYFGPAYGYAGVGIFAGTVMVYPRAYTMDLGAPPLIRFHPMFEDLSGKAGSTASRLTAH